MHASGGVAESGGNGDEHDWLRWPTGWVAGGAHFPGKAVGA